MLIAIFLLSHTVCYVYSLQCLRCDRVISPRHCHGKTTCDSHEVCSLERFTGLDGETLYNVGCKSRELCHNYVYDDKAATRRTLPQGEVTTCSTCCSGNLCNVAGCGAQGYPSNRGPICYNCAQSLNPEKCDQITVCGRDDMCHIEYQEEFGDYFYTTKCISKHLCDLNGANIFGKRAIEKRNTKCSACCHGDLCNSNCFHNSVTGYTQPYTHTTPTPPWQYHSTSPWYHHHSTSPWYHHHSTSPWYHHHSTKPWYYYHSTSPTWQQESSSRWWKQETTPLYPLSTVPPPVITDHRGLSFAVLFMTNINDTKVNKQLELLITSEHTHYSVMIQTSQGGQHVKQQRLYSTNRVIRTTIPSTFEHAPLADEQHNLAYSTGILISSDKPVSVVGMSDYNCCSGDAFHAIPTHSLGRRYILASYPNGTRSYGVVATEDNTIIKSTLLNKAYTRIKINAMESKIVNTGDDITGSIIESDKPVGVFSGNEETFINDKNGFFQTEMLIPVDKFAMQYIVPKVAKGKFIILRIVPAEDGHTTVYITGKNGFYKNTYEKYVNTLQLPNDGYFINAQRPVMVTLYSSYESPSLHPFMTLVPAVKQFSNNYVITTPTMNRYDNYATVIIDARDREDGLRVNGAHLLFHAVDDTSINMFNDVYRSISVRLDFNDTVYEIAHINKNVKFGLIVYGYKDGSAYGYPGGFIL